MQTVIWDQLLWEEALQYCNNVKQATAAVKRKQREASGIEGGVNKQSFDFSLV